MPIKVLVIDDSLFMRKTITQIISSDEIVVVGTAANGKEGVSLARELKPDVITMDIEMPVMNGLDALKEIMRHSPTQVLMVSSLTSEGAEVTLEALHSGAVDFITKKSAFTQMHSLKDELISKIKSIAGTSSVKSHKNKSLAPAKPTAKFTSSDTAIAERLKSKASKVSLPSSPEILKRRPAKSQVEIIGIGVSTGGPVALAELLPLLHASLPVPILIVQHMPAYFTKSLAERLNKSSPLTVKEAANGDAILPGHVYLAPGGLQMTVHRKSKIIISDGDPKQLYKPSVDVMMNSIVESYAGKALGVIMTGMGHDGENSFLALDRAGGYIIAQEPTSCIVPGMTNSVIKHNIASEILPVANIANALSSIFA